MEKQALLSDLKRWGVSDRGAGTTCMRRRGASSLYLLSILLLSSYFSDSYFITTSSPITLFAQFLSVVRDNTSCGVALIMK